jgi:hypothetical protein
MEAIGFIVRFTLIALLLMTFKQGITIRTDIDLKTLRPQRDIAVVRPNRPDARPSKEVLEDVRRTVPNPDIIYGNDPSD